MSIFRSNRHQVKAGKRCSALYWRYALILAFCFGAVSASAHVHASDDAGAATIYETLDCSYCSVSHMDDAVLVQLVLVHYSFIPQSSIHASTSTVYLDVRHGLPQGRAPPQ